MFLPEDLESCAKAGIDVERSYSEMMLDVRMGGPVMQRLCRSMSDTWENRGDELSDVERRTLQWLAEGMTSATIRSRYGVSESAVRDQIGKASRKLGARNRTHAVAIAIRTGLIRGAA